MAEQEEFKPVKAYPRFDLVSDFEWIDKYPRQIATQAELQDLKAQRKKIKHGPLLASDKAVELKKYYDGFKERQAAALGRFLATWNPSANPFTPGCEIFRILDIQKQLPEWDDFVDALEAMPEQAGALSLADKDKALSKIDAEIEAVSAKLMELFPKYSRFRKQGDARSEFLQYWVDTQRQCSAACTHTGMDLKLAPKHEQDAYHALKISDFINSKGLKPCQQY